MTRPSDGPPRRAAHPPALVAVSMLLGFLTGGYAVLLYEAEGYFALGLFVLGGGVAGVSAVLLTLPYWTPDGDPWEVADGE